MTRVVITASQYSVTVTVTCKQQCPHEGDWGLNDDTAQLVQLLKSINIPIESAQAGGGYPLSRFTDAKGRVLHFLDVTSLYILVNTFVMTSLMLMISSAKQGILIGRPT